MSVAGIAVLFAALFCAIYILERPKTFTASAPQAIEKNDTLTARKEYYKIFPPLKNKIFADAGGNTLSLRKYIIGISYHGAAKAYPIQFMAVHHKIHDTIGGMPVMVTYCAECRSGRVYKPVVNGTYTTFNVIGMARSNVVYEDALTKSCWSQENGECIEGPLIGKYLDEVPSQQMTLNAWIREHPNTLILQRDPTYDTAYNAFAGFASGKIHNYDLAEDHQPKRKNSWVIGVLAGDDAKAYDWMILKRKKVVNDTVGSTPDLVFIEPDGKSFHVYDRTVDGKSLLFKLNATCDRLVDTRTRSEWRFDGEAVSGPMKGKKLRPLHAYQEFLHSWYTFHPHSTGIQSAWKSENTW